MEGVAIRARGLWKTFGSRDALANVSLEVPAGAVQAVLGPNGSGKTTLLRILCTLTLPSSGEVEVLGRSLPRQGSQARARMGVVLDHHLLPRDFTLKEGLHYYADLYGVPDPAPRIEALADRFQLRSRLQDPVRTYSRGMAQRAGLMRALLHDPDLLLLDEPFNGLDQRATEILEEVIRETARSGRTVVLVTHDRARAASLASCTLHLDRGRVVEPAPLPPESRS